MIPAYPTLFRTLFGSIVATILLSACGGGGGSSNPSPPPPPPPPPPNQPPTANAGADQVVVEGNMVTLSAAGSSDSDGSIAGYAWTQTSGDSVTLQGADTVTASFDPPLTDSQLVMTFEVNVTDDDGATATASTTVTIEPSQPPAANAGPDDETVERENLVLSGSATDIDGNIASYAWLQLTGPAVTINSPDTATPDFDAPVVTDITTLEFELTVTDNTGDTGTDTVSVNVNPNEPPELAVHFPCDTCRFYSPPFSVSGSITAGADNTFVENLDSITSLTVSTGGASFVDATIQQDGKWFASDVPLNIVNSDIFVVVNATDDFGETSSAVMILAHQPTFASVLFEAAQNAPGFGYLFETNNSIERMFNVEFPSGTFSRIRERQPEFDPESVLGMSVNAATTHAYLVEPAGTIDVVDLATGVRTVLSDASTGTGPAFDSPTLMALDENSSRLIVFNENTEALLQVSTVNGDRTAISQTGGAGSGPDFGAVVSLTVDQSNDIAYLYQASDTFLSVDLATGARAVLPNSGANIVNQAFIDFDPTRSRIIVAERVTGNVYFVDVSTGARTLLSDDSAWPALSIGVPRGIEYDVQADLYVINDFSNAGIGDNDTDRLIAVNPGNGNRTDYFSDSRGSGPDFQDPNSIAIDVVTGTGYVANQANDSILSADLLTGDRQVVSDAFTGNGPAFDSVRDIVLDTANDRALVVDAGNAALIAVSLSTGNRSTVSGGVIGGGTAFSMPVALTADYANNRMFIVDQGLDQILAVDLLTGLRTTVSDNSDSGPALQTTQGIALDAANNRLLVTELAGGATADTRLLAIDIDSGERTTVSGFATGSGPFLNDPADLVLLEGGEFAVIEAGSQFYLVELASGNRQVLAAKNVGGGESLRLSSGVAYNPETDTLYTVSRAFEALFAIDVLTGSRVMISK